MDSQEKKEPQTPPQPSIERELPLDTRLLSEAVIELNISRKNVGIYPAGHIQITRSIDRAFELLLRLFEVRPEMTLGVAKDTLLVGQDYLDRKNPVYRDFALSMNQQGIAAVTFISGLDKGELVKFHRILTTKPEDIRASGSIEAVMSASGIQHIRIMAINYDGFHVTEEKEIFKPAAKAAATSGGDVWQDFVSLLSTGTLAGQGQGVSLKDAEHVDPAELARLLNERKLDPTAAIQSYDRIISSHVRGAAEKKDLTHEQSKTLASLNALIKDLNPELRKQFLSVAFQRASSSATPAGAEEVVGGLTDDMVIEMLAQANVEGREISPTLTGLVGKLAYAHGQTDVPAEQRKEWLKQGRGGLSAPLILPEHMQKLFDREKYEEYVSADYEAMLKQMTETPVVVTGEFSLEEHAKTLEDSHLDFQIGRALVAFMEENIDEEDYKEFAAKLVAIAPQFLESGNFELLFDISDTLRRHASEKPLPGIQAAAEEARKIFADPEFILKALHAFEIWMKDKGQEAANLIQSLGPDVIPGLMDIFSRDESLGGRRVLFNLLCLFGEPAIGEAQKRLGDPRAYYVRNLLIFIRRAGTVASIPHIKPLLQHKELSVRMEALSTLLRFKDPGSVKFLRDAILSDDPDVASQAVSLAGQFRVVNVTEDVLARIKRVILFEADYQWNAEIIKALGEIGDPRAIPDLEKLARANWPLYPQSRLKFKETLFESLGRYPGERIANLLRIGAGLNSEKIKRACKKLSEKG
jgi:HEAT repeat protein